MRKSVLSTVLSNQMLFPLPCLAVLDIINGNFFTLSTYPIFPNSPVCAFVKPLCICYIYKAQ